MLPLRYDDLGTINAVKLLPLVNSYDGYIQLYTEIDSHIEEGDNIFITFSGDSSNYPNDDIILDNFIYLNKSDDFIYSDFSTGYKVIHVNKNINSFVIDRHILTIPPNKKLYGHYVSKCVVNNIDIKNGSIDSTLFKNINIMAQNNSVKWVQGIVMDGDIENIELSNKYNLNYISLNLTYNDSENFSKVATLNNNTFGYSYFYDLNHSIKNCDIENGIYYNCSISADDLTYKISNGMFEECNISALSINNGLYKNTSLGDQVIWNYGQWENDQEPFNLPVWNDGLFLNGVFGVDEATESNEWKNGYFLNGEFKGRIWRNGKFQNGNFSGKSWLDTVQYPAFPQRKSTIWYDGDFNGGYMNGEDINGEYEMIMLNAKINGGEINNIIISNSEFTGGVVSASTIKTSNIIGSSIHDSIILKSSLKEGNVFNSKLSDNILENDIISTTSEYYYNNIIENGEFNENNFINKTTINNGKFNSNIFQLGKKSLLKCVLSSKKLWDGADFDTKILVTFFDGHDFSLSDTGKIIELGGFNSIDINNLNNITISDNIYFKPSPSSIDINGDAVYDTYPSVGENYILIDGDFKPYYQGAIGYISINDIDHFNSNNLNTIINDGNFSRDYFNNVIINDGNFVKTSMRNGTKFNNGNFRGGNFSSEFDELENEWYDGNFYYGTFGNRLIDTGETYIVIQSGHTEVIKNSTIFSDIFIEKIYPAHFTTNSGIVVDDDLIVPENGLYSWTKVDTTSNMIYYYDVETQNQNQEVWSGSSDYTSNVAPYRLVFKIDCVTSENKLVLKEWINRMTVTSINGFIGLVDLDFQRENPFTASTMIYETLNDLYDSGDFDENGFLSSDMGYKIINTISGPDNYYYFIFESAHVRNLWFDANITERESYKENFRNAWSVANTGYYTHPLPVLSDLDNDSGGTSDTQYVTNYELNADGNTTTSKWIYGTSVPPWWLKTKSVWLDSSNPINPGYHALPTTAGDYYDFYDIDWEYELGSNHPSNLKFITPTLFNNQTVENYDINILPNDNISTLRDDIINFNEKVEDFSNISTYIPYDHTFKEWMTYHIKNKNKKGVDLGLNNKFDSYNLLEEIQDTAGWNQHTGYIDTDIHDNIVIFEENSNNGNTFETTFDNNEYLITIKYQGNISIYFKYENIGYNTQLPSPLFTPSSDINRLLKNLNSNTLVETTFRVLNLSNFINLFVKNNNSDGSFTRIDYLIINKVKKESSVTIDEKILNDGVSWYGIPLVDQNNIYSPTPIPDKLIEQGDSIYNYNSQDSILFEAYWRYRRGDATSLSNALSLNKIFNKYYAESIIDDVYFQDDEKDEFKNWNNNIQTSSLNFNRVAGIQFKTLNLPINNSSFRDTFYGGNFYNGVFEGKWNGGKWNIGTFNGWNNLVPVNTPESITPPIETNSNIAISTITYHEDIEHLKRNKKYYEIPPWEQDQKNTYKLSKDIKNNYKL